MTRGTLKNPAPSAGVGALASASSRAKRWPHLVGAIGGHSREHAGRRRNAARVDLLHLVGVGEDIAELLSRTSRSRFVVELELRERGDGRHLFAAVNSEGMGIC